MYAFGVLMWEMLTSSRAWAGLRHAHIICMVGVQNQTLAIPEGLHPTLESLLSRCLARKPEDRPSFKSIADTLSHFVQVTRGADPADLWGQSASSPPGGCLCSLAGADCCTTCGHMPGCVQASCFSCQFLSAAASTASAKEHTGSTPSDGAAASQLPNQSPNQSPCHATVSTPDVESKQQSTCHAAVSKLDMEEAIASAKGDQATPSYSCSPGGKGMRRTLLSI